MRVCVPGRHEQGGFADIEPLQSRVLCTDRLVGDADRQHFPFPGERGRRVEGQGQLGTAQGVGSAGADRAALDRRLVRINTRGEVHRNDRQGPAAEFLDDLAGHTAGAAHHAGPQHRIDDERGAVEMASRRAPGRRIRRFDDRNAGLARGAQIGRGISLHDLLRRQQDDPDVHLPPDQVARRDQAVPSVVSFSAKDHHTARG